ncbi:MAG: hypothetical protein ACE147_11220 [Candidatus Methylomirabilales bacterium]
MAIVYPDVPARFHVQLAESLALIRARVTRAALPRDLRATLLRFLSPARTPVVQVFLGTRATRGRWGCSSGYCIWIQPRTFRPSPGAPRSRLPAVLFHELVHVAGGSELDAEAFENLLFTTAEGAVPPTSGDWSSFAAHQGVGQWVKLAGGAVTAPGAARQTAARLQQTHSNSMRTRRRT